MENCNQTPFFFGFLLPVLLFLSVHLSCLLFLFFPFSFLLLFFILPLSSSSSSRFLSLLPLPIPLPLPFFPSFPAVVVALAAAELLGRPSNYAVRSLPRNIMFSLYHGVREERDRECVCVCVCVCVCMK